MKYLKLKNRIKKLERLYSDSSWSKFKLGQENERLKEKIERLEKLNKDLVQEKAFLNIELKNKVKKLEKKNELLEYNNYRLEEEIKKLKFMESRRREFNQELTRKIASLRAELEKKSKEPVAFNISIDKEDVDDIVKKVTENVLGKEEKHECTEICFKHHVLDPIQADIYSKFGDDIVTRSKNLDEMVQFVETWRIKLLKEYPFLEDLYTRDFGELTAVYK